MCMHGCGVGDVVPFGWEVKLTYASLLHEYITANRVKPQCI